MGNNMNERVSAVIINDSKILLIRRIKPGREYYVFPGGGVEEGEDEQYAMLREIKEELSINAKIERLLFEVENQSRKELYFLIREVINTPKLGGPEKERINEQNQYIIEWVELDKIPTMDNLYPQEAVAKLMEFLRTQK